MKYFHSICLAVLLALMSCSSGNSSSSKPILAVSIDPQRKILEEIVGDNYEIVTVLSAGANPESFEPSVAQRIDVNKADAYFTIGYLPFENTLAHELKGDKVVDTSKGIEIITGTHQHSHSDDADHHHSHSDADPHTWTSYRNSKTIAANMLNAVIALDPDNAEAYKQNYARLAHRLDSLDAVTAQQLSQAGTHAFAIWHPSLSYYAKDYGLHQMAIGQESKEISISALKSIIEEAKEDSVKIFFFQKEYDSRQANNVSKEIGTELVTINPLAYDWEEQLMMITDKLTQK